MKAGNFFFFFFTLLLVSRVEAQPNKQLLRKIQRIICNNPLRKVPGCRAAIVGALGDLRRSNGCIPNICFAIDGSRQMGKADFERQLDFVAVVTTLVGFERARFAGTQYGVRNKVIRDIRGNATDFLLDLEQVRYLRSGKSFIGGGVSYCFQQLNKRRGEPAKMIILGDGRSSYGRVGGPLGPAALAADFRSRSLGNTVCAVAVGFSRTDLFNDITQDPKLVLKVTEWPKILGIIGDLVRNICPVRPV